MTQNDNPFSAPSARVADLPIQEGTYIAGGRRVAAGSGINWLSGGWALFRQAPGVWIGITVIMMLIVIVLSLIPLLNLAVNILVPILAGGIMLGCKALDKGESLTIGHLFAGFSEYGGNLALVGLIYFAGAMGIMVVVGILAAVLGVGVALSGGQMGAGTILGMAVLGLFAVALLFPLAMALWYAPPLVIFHRESPFQAMKTSFFACIKNFVPFLVYSLVVLVLAIVATLPLALGWLVLVPTLYGSMYVSYKDIFTES